MRDLYDTFVSTSQAMAVFCAAHAACRL